MLVPGAGFVAHRAITAGVTDYVAIGPVPVGAWISRVEVSAWMEGQAGPQTMAVGVGVSLTPDASAGAWAGSTNLVQASETTVVGRPGLLFSAPAVVFGLVRLFPGYWAQGAPVWVLFAVTGSGTGVIGWFNGVVETKRLLLVPVSGVVPGVALL